MVDPLAAVALNIPTGQGWHYVTSLLQFTCNCYNIQGN